MIWFVRVMHLYLRKTEGLGFGDVKLIGVISLWAGFAYLPILIIISSILAIFHVLITSKLFLKKEKLDIYEIDARNLALACINGKANEKLDILYHHTYYEKS